MIDIYTTDSANGQRPLIMLEECGLAYRKQYYDRRAGEHRNDHYYGVNPLGQIPTLIDHDVEGAPVTVTQSAAIVFYLAEKTGNLLPKGLAARAEVMECVFLGMTDLHATASQLLMVERSTPEGERSPYQSRTTRERMIRLFTEINRRVAATGYLAGDYSIADICIFATANRADYLAFIQDTPAFGPLRRWHALVAARPAVQRGVAAANR